MTTSTAVVRGEVSDALPKRMNGGGIKALLTHDQVRARIEPFLADGVRYDQVIAAAQLAAERDPKLLNCSVVSVVGSVATIMRWGLEIGTTAYLLPFKDVCTPVADYKGIAQLMIASRAIRHVEAHAVYEGDGFEFTQGSEARLYHSPNTDRKARGKLKGAYAILHLPFGVKVWDYMPVEDIDEIRQRYSKQWKQGAVPGWYAKKTVVRQIAKMVPKDARLAKVLGVVQEDQATEFGGVADVPRLADGDDDDIPRAPQVTGGEADQGGGQRPGAESEGSQATVAKAAAPATPATDENETERIIADALVKLEARSFSGDDARAFPLSWRKSADYGQPVGTLSRNHLTAIVTWCEDAEHPDRMENPRNAALHTAASLVLADIDSQQGALDLSGEDAEQAADLAAHTGESTPDRRSDAGIQWPGISDRSSAALIDSATVGELADRARALLALPAHQQRIDAVREKLKRGNSRKALATLVTELEAAAEVTTRGVPSVDGDDGSSLPF